MRTVVAATPANPTMQTLVFCSDGAVFWRDPGTKQWIEADAVPGTERAYERSAVPEELNPY